MISRNNNRNPNRNNNTNRNRNANRNSNQTNQNNNRGFAEKLKNAVENVKTKGSELAQSASNTANGLSSGLQNKVDDLKAAANNSEMLGSIKKSGNLVGDAAKDFSEKNNTVSKFIFIIFTFILFGLALRLGVYILSLFVAPNKNPIVIDGMVNTNSLSVYQVNPSASESKPILRSINENQGLEFSWNTWIYIENVNTGSGREPKRFFAKGGKSNTEQRFATDAPGLYLWDETNPQDNTITVTMTTFLSDEERNENEGDDMLMMEQNDIEAGIDNIEKVVIKNIPIQKWVNITIRVQNKILDVYINGVLSKRHTTKGVFKQNYGDIYVGDSFNGPAGLLSALRYYSYAIGNREIQMIMNEGPNLKMVGSNHKDSTGPYLASRWYLDNIIDK